MSATLTSFKTEGFLPGGFIASNPSLLLSESITVAAGAVLKAGTVLGKVTASGKYVVSAAAAEDGSQTPIAILVHDADAASADVATLAYTRGDFIAEGLTFGTGHTADSTRAGLKAQGIYLIHQQGGL